MNSIEIVCLCLSVPFILFVVIPFWMPALQRMCDRYVEWCDRQQR